MNIRLKVMLTLLCLSPSVALTQVKPSDFVVNHDGPLVVSPTLPKDSRDEIVYTNQGQTEKDQPVVPGVYTPPLPIKVVHAKYPRSFKKARVEADVKVKGVIAQSGEFIDASLPDPLDPEWKKSVMDAAKQYKFKPATLDGKPIAVRGQIEFRFRIR
jgi:TonB family protein